MVRRHDDIATITTTRQPSAFLPKIALLGLLVLLGLLFVSTGVTTPDPPERPKVVFERFAKAIVAEDWGVVYDCIDTATRKSILYDFSPGAHPPFRGFPIAHGNTDRERFVDGFRCLVERLRGFFEGGISEALAVLIRSNWDKISVRRVWILGDKATLLLSDGYMPVMVRESGNWKCALTEPAMFRQWLIGKKKRPSS